MRRFFIFAIVLHLAAAAGPSLLFAAEILDRIVARIEGDIITLSEVRELGAFQQLSGRESPRGDDALLGELIEQWMVANDATAARYPLPAPAEVDRQVAALEPRAGTREEFESRLAAVGLTRKALRRQVEREIYFGRYLDYKFRPTVQIEPEAIERYYRESLLPQLASRGEAAPPLDKVSDQVRELLLQQEISRRTEEWLRQTRIQVRVEILKPQEAGAPPQKPAQNPQPGPASHPSPAPGDAQ
jgi:hypothetical protein